VDLEGVRSLHRLVIVLSNLAGVAVQFLYQFIGSVVNSEMISGLWENKLINVATCLVFLAIATYIAYRSIDTTEHVQMVLVLFQLVILVLFSVLAIAKSGASEVGEAFSWAWLSPAGLTSRRSSPDSRVRYSPSGGGTRP
jgi:amino acid transporter